jgi:hypothetical protein
MKKSMNEMKNSVEGYKDKFEQVEEAANLKTGQWELVSKAQKE